MIKIKLILGIAICILLCSFIQSDGIPSCFLNFKASKLVKATGDAVKTPIAKPYRIKTGKTDHTMSPIEANTVIYNNAKNFAFIKLRVEQCSSKNYGKDTNAVYNNLKLQMKEGKRFENSYLIEKNYNGSMLYGYSHNTLDKDSIQSSWAFFPGNDCIIYINFMRLKPEQCNYSTVGEFRIQRDNFLSYYTAHLRKCLIPQ